LVLIPEEEEGAARRGAGSDNEAIPVARRSREKTRDNVNRTIRQRESQMMRRR